MAPSSVAAAPQTRSARDPGVCHPVGIIRTTPHGTGPSQAALHSGHAWLNMRPYMFTHKKQQVTCLMTKHSSTSSTSPLLRKLPLRALSQRFSLIGARLSGHQPQGVRAARADIQASRVKASFSICTRGTASTKHWGLRDMTKEKTTPSNVITRASIPRSSPQLLLKKQQSGQVTLWGVSRQ